MPMKDLRRLPVVDAVLQNRSARVQFPTSREKNGESFEFRLLTAQSVLWKLRIIRALPANSLRTGTGYSSSRKGNSICSIGNRRSEKGRPAATGAAAWRRPSIRAFSLDEATRPTELQTDTRRRFLAATVEFLATPVCIRRARESTGESPMIILLHTDYIAP